MAPVAAVSKWCIFLLDSDREESATIGLDIDREHHDVGCGLAFWEGDEVCACKQGLEGRHIGCGEGCTRLSGLDYWSEGYGHGFVLLVLIS